MPALEQAPPFPGGSIDFNAFNDACAKGAADPFKNAVITPDAQVSKAAAPEPVPAAKADKE